MTYHIMTTIFYNDTRTSMLKYVDYYIVFQEIPGEVTLSVSISNCPCRCPGCHSHYLWEDTGNPLTIKVIESLLQKYGSEITCLCFMGGDAEPAHINTMAQFINYKFPNIKVGWYSGRTKLSSTICTKYFDYIKIGPYIKHLGGLKDRTTNQRLFKKTHGGKFIDITEQLQQIPIKDTI